jgi:hypothetical protein
MKQRATSTGDNHVRAQEKQASRDADARALASGRITREQLNQDNRFLRGEACVVRYDLIRRAR